MNEKEIIYLVICSSIYKSIMGYVVTRIKWSVHGVVSRKCLSFRCVLTRSDGSSFLHPPVITFPWLLFITPSSGVVKF